MMKKNYLKPETIQLNMVIENTILADSETNVGGDMGDASAGKNRGEWGSVWK